MLLIAVTVSWLLALSINTDLCSNVSWSLFLQHNAAPSLSWSLSLQQRSAVRPLVVVSALCVRPSCPVVQCALVERAVSTHLLHGFRPVSALLVSKAALISAKPLSSTLGYVLFITISSSTNKVQLWPMIWTRPGAIQDGATWRLIQHNRTTVQQQLF